MFSKEVNLLGGHGIVGAQIALGAGIAFAEKYKGTKNVCITSMGDGAVRQGILHETFNMAMNWKLPVVFLIENNNYAMGTSVERTSNVKDLSEIGESYDMPAKSVNGMKVEDVHDAIKWGAEHARAGKGPVLLDVRTYRYKGHSMSDPQKYRTKEEVQSYKEQDPIKMVLETIEQNKLAGQKAIQNIQDRVKAKVEESIQFAEQSEEPSPEELYIDNYVEADYPFIRDNKF